MYWVKRG